MSKPNNHHLLNYVGENKITLSVLMAVLILHTRMQDQSNLGTQSCRLIFWVKCSFPSIVTQTRESKAKTVCSCSPNFSLNISLKALA
jgi:hypothetical protein